MKELNSIEFKKMRVIDSSDEDSKLLSNEIFGKIEKNTIIKIGNYAFDVEHIIQLSDDDNKYRLINSNESIIIEGI